MRTIVFIGMYKSGSSRDAVRAAEKLGYFTVVFTGREKSLLQRGDFSDVHEMVLIDQNDLEAMRKKIQQLQDHGKDIELIISFVEPHVHTAALLCKEFCNKTLPLDAILKMQNKIQTRLALQNTLFNIRHAVSDEVEALDSFMEKHMLDYPIIIKSPGSSGSKDVLKAKDLQELSSHVGKLRERYSDTPVLFEEYIDGPQYLVEVLVYNEQVHIVAVIEQEILKRQFIITGYSLLAKVPEELYESIYFTVCSIIKKLEFTKGSCHFELRRVNNEWKVIEINPRISGSAMNRMIEAAYGINLVEQIIKVWLGEEPSLQRKHERFVFTQYITVSSKGTLEKVTGKKRAMMYKGVVHVYIKPRIGTYLHPPLSMGQRYAYVLAAASTMEQARTIAKSAAMEIKLHLS
jgi:biotin carboxylase